MPNPADVPSRTVCEEIDYSAPEMQQALACALDIVMEIRQDQTSPLARRVALYERTLGFAVIPSLIKRGLVAAAREARQRLRAHG